MLDLAFRIWWQCLAKHLQRSILGGGGEGKVAGVRHHLARRHTLLNGVVHHVLGVTLPLCIRVFVVRSVTQGFTHGGRGFTTLTRMRLVDEDGELTPPVLIANDLQDERKGLDGGNYDFLAIGDELPQLFRFRAEVARHGAHRGAHLHELFDGFLNLVVQNAPVSHHNHRIERLFAIVLDANQLVCQPGNGVRLAATRRVLNQVSLAHAVLAHMT